MAEFSVITYALCNKNTQKVISEAIEGLSEGMAFKGSVATLNDLPSDPNDGDLYIIENIKSKVVFFDGEWVEFDHEINLVAGQNIDIELDSEGNTIISSSGAGAGTWGSITGTLSDQTDLQDKFDQIDATLGDIDTALDYIIGELNNADTTNY